MVKEFRTNVLKGIIPNISMVVYKKRSNKSTAIIKVPKFDKNGKHDGYEIIGYEEWHERFNDIATWLEKELGL